MDGEDSSDLGSLSDLSSDDDLICQLRDAGLMTNYHKRRKHSCKDVGKKIRLGKSASQISVLVTILVFILT